MTIEAPPIGLDAFVAGLARQGIASERSEGLLVYRVVPVEGAYAGTEVETGIELAELDGWPRTPPHWIHLPSTLVIPSGSPNSTKRPGWTKYSRPHPGRLDAATNPSREWVAHVRALIGTAT